MYHSQLFLKSDRPAYSLSCKKDVYKDLLQRVQNTID